MCVLSLVWLVVIWWTIASQAPLSMGSPRWDYWSGLPLPPPKDLPDPGIELTSPELADEYPLDHQGHGLGQVWLLLTLQSCVCVLTSDTGEADGHCLRTALNRKTRKSKRVVVPLGNTRVLPREHSWSYKFVVRFQSYVFLVTLRLFYKLDCITHFFLRLVNYQQPIWIHFDW